MTSGELLRSGMFTLWGVATLILAICVGLLLYGRAEEGESGFDLSLAKSPEARSVPMLEDGGPTESRDVHLYFADPNAIRIEAETRSIAYVGDTIDNCRNALQALIEGPRGGLIPVVPEGTKIRGVYLLEGGELVVDFSRELELSKVESATGQQVALISSATAELLMIRAIVATLVQPQLKAADDRPIRKIRFLLEGSPPQDKFPAHIDLSDPVEFDVGWIGGGSESNA